MTRKRLVLRPAGAFVEMLLEIALVLVAIPLHATPARCPHPVASCLASPPPPPPLPAALTTASLLESESLWTMLASVGFQWMSLQSGMLSLSLIRMRTTMGGIQGHLQVLVHEQVFIVF